MGSLVVYSSEPRLEKTHVGSIGGIRRSTLFPLPLRSKHELGLVGLSVVVGVLHGRSSEMMGGRRINDENCGI